MQEYNLIVGVDISLQDTGIVAIIYGDKWVPYRLLSTKQGGKLRDIEREVFIAHTILKNVNEFRQVYNVGVVLEDHAFGINTGKSRTRAELVGIIKYLLLVNAGVDVFLVSPTALKKFMGCSDKKSRGDKEAMFVACSQRFGFTHTNHNIVDAYCLTRYLVANRDGQTLPIVKQARRAHLKLVQVPAQAKVYKLAKNLRLTK